MTTSSTRPASIADSAVNQAVQALIERQVGEGRQVGVQVCAYRDGKPVVDAWAGTMGPNDPRPIQPDSLILSFSVTKGVTALAIHILAERGLIRFERSLTNREVLARVDASAPARAHLSPVVETFDRVWYGEREPDEATFHVYSQEIDALLREGTADVPNPDHKEGTVARRG